MKPIILIIVLSILSINSLFALTVIDATKVSPTTESITIYRGSSLTFKAKGFSDYLVSLFEWYLDGELIGGKNFTNNYDIYGETSTITQSFNTVGTFTISFYCYNKDETVSQQEDFVWWKVTVLNNPPSKPTNPYPSDGKKEVIPNTILQWTSSSDPDGKISCYNVYFGTSSNPSIYAKPTTNSLSFDEILDIDEHYYWRVEAVDNEGAKTSSDLWDFYTIKPTGYLDVTLKNVSFGSQSIPGSKGRIDLYNSENNKIDSKTTNTSGEVFFETDPGNNYYVETFFSPGNTIHGSEFWGKLGAISITNNATTTKTLVRNMPYTDRFELYNANTFERIEGKMIKKGEPIKARIYMKSLSNDVNLVKNTIYLDKNKTSGYDVMLTSDVISLPANGETLFDYTFTPETTGEYYFTTATATKYNSNYVITDGWAWSSNPAFTVYEPTIGTVTLNSPVGGETWQADTEQTITWDYTGKISTIELRYSTDGGVTWTDMASPDKDAKIYKWTVPNIDSENCMIKISGLYNATESNFISSVFLIQKTDISSSIIKNNNWVDNHEYETFELYGKTYNWKVVIGDIELIDGSVKKHFIPLITYVPNPSFPELDEPIKDRDELLMVLNYVLQIKRGCYYLTRSKKAWNEHAKILALLSDIYDEEKAKQVSSAFLISEIMFKIGSHMLTGGSYTVLSGSAELASIGSATINYMQALSSNPSHFEMKPALIALGNINPSGFAQIKNNKEWLDYIKYGYDLTGIINNSFEATELFLKQIPEMWEKTQQAYKILNDPFASSSIFGEIEIKSYHSYLNQSLLKSSTSLGVSMVGNVAYGGTTDIVESFSNSIKMINFYAAVLRMYAIEIQKNIDLISDHANFQTLDTYNQSLSTFIFNSSMFYKTYTAMVTNLYNYDLNYRNNCGLKGKIIVTKNGLENSKSVMDKWLYYNDEILKHTVLTESITKLYDYYPDFSNLSIPPAKDDIYLTNLNIPSQSPAHNELVTFKIDVANISKFAYSDFQLSLTNNGVEVLTIPIQMVKPGETTSLSFNWTAIPGSNNLKIEMLNINDEIMSNNSVEFDYNIDNDIKYLLTEVSEDNTFKAYIQSPGEIKPANTTISLYLNEKEYLLGENNSGFSDILLFESTISELNDGNYSFYYSANFNGTEYRQPVIGAYQLTINSSSIVNTPPIANAGSNQTVYEGAFVTLLGSESIDQDKDKLTFTWTSPHGIELNSNSIPNPSFSAPIVQNSTDYIFTLLVNDGTVDSEPDEVIITVLPKTEPIVYIPDSIFKAYLINNTEINTNGDGEIQLSEAEVFTGTINVSDDPKYPSGKTIYDLTGIECFPLISELHCSFNEIEKLDVSKNTELLKLFLDQNNIKFLDISKNTKLQSLSCVNNNLSEIDLTQNTEIRYLFITNTGITELDISKNLRLVSLACNQNAINSIDITKNIELGYLVISNIGISYIDLSQNTKLISLDCRYNSLSYLEISKNTALITLDCSHNSISTLNVAKNNQLDRIDCSYNQLKKLDVSLNSKLTSLNCSNNQLEELNLKNSNNENIKITPTYYFSCLNNPNLSCVTVDDPNYSASNWQSHFDTGIEFSLDCSQIENQAPIANAGIDLTVPEGETVTLDGSQSSDPNGDEISYLWIVPEGITLDANNIAMPSFMAPKVTLDTTYTFVLVVNDGMLNSNTDEVIVTIKAQSNDNCFEFSETNASKWLGGGVGRTSNIGTGQSLIIENDCSLKSFSVQMPFRNEEYTATLELRNASGHILHSFIGLLKDVENGWLKFEVTTLINLIANNKYIFTWYIDNAEYNQIMGSSYGHLDSTKINGQGYTGMILQGEDLSHWDKWGKHPWDFNFIICTMLKDENLPIANAGIDQTITEGSIAILDGTLSYDPEGDQLSYQWVAPSGIILSSSTEATPTFTAPNVDADTVYVFSLSVSDGVNNSNEDEVMVTVKNSISTYYRKLTLTQATLDNIEQNSSQPVFEVESGQTLNGTYKITFETNVASSNVFPLAITPNWGDKTTVYWQEVNDMSNGITYSGNYSIKAPTKEGNYYLIFANMSEFTAAQILSATHWGDASPTWNDGNDIYDLPDYKIQSGILNGSITHSMLNAGLYSDQSFGLTAIKFKVASEPNRVPIANAGLDQTVNEGATATLDGSASSEPDGDVITYLWTAPNGITLSSNTTQKPAFIAPTIGADAQYEFILVVSDGVLCSEPDTVVVFLKKQTIEPHFTTIWTGNGTDHMNFNVVTAKIDGVDLEAGDEIGLFDGNLCVGAGVLTSTASSTNVFSMVASANDGSGNGYTDGNNIVYKLYDRSADKEFTNIEAIYHNDMPDWVTDGKYQINGTTVVELAASSNITQNIVLNTGWNIISSTVIPSDLNLKNIFQPLIDSGKLRKVMDESGKSVENLGIFGGWTNNIGNLSATKGYKVNVTSECSLSVEGAPVSMPLTLALNAGWNIVSFPALGNQDGKAAFQSLMDAGKVKKVMDEAGKSIENLGIFGGWQNNIGDLKPGKGYKVNVNTACQLVLNNDMSKSALIVPEMLASAYFKPAFEGNGTDHMNINLVKLAESGIMEGDQVGVFDGETCVGSATVGAGQLNQDYISIPASMNDGLQAKPNGYTRGNAIKLRVFRNGEESDLNFDLINGYSRFAQGESMIASANGLQAANMERIGTGQVNVSCYPNPFNESIHVDLIIEQSQHLVVTVFDLYGRKIKTLFRGRADGKLQLQWQGDNEQDQAVRGGLYLCRVNGITYKMVKH